MKQVGAHPDPTILQKAKDGKTYSLTEKGLKYIETMAANGYSLELMAAELSISPRTFDALRSEQRQGAEISEAIRIGAGHAQARIINRLFDIADSGDSMAAVRALETLAARRFNLKDGGTIEDPNPQPHQATGQSNIVINLTPGLSKAEFDAVQIEGRSIDAVLGITDESDNGGTD